MYGISIKEENDEYIAIAEAALQALLAAGLTPGKYLVQHLPSLRHVPSWFPGTGWREVFDGWRNAVKRLKDEPFAHVQRTVVREPVPPTILEGHCHGN